MISMPGTIGVETCSLCMVLLEVSVLKIFNEWIHGRRKKALVVVSECHGNRCSLFSFSF